MRKRPFLIATLACLLSVAHSASAKQYPPRPPAPRVQEPVAAPSPEDQPPEVPSPDIESSAIQLPGSPSSSSEANTARPRVITEGLPYTPYPAGLPWVITPQAFRVPIPNRIYYPPQHYVRRCPYFPRGYYWGANWRFNVIGCDNLLFCGTFRYNPYLTAHKAQHDPKLRGQRRYAMPPGPEGQAVLLGVNPSPPPPVPPTFAKKTKPEDGDADEQVAADDAGEKPAAQPASSRRTARKKDRDLQ